MSEERAAAYAQRLRSLFLLGLTVCLALLFSFDHNWTTTIEVKRSAAAVLGGFALLALAGEYFCGSRWLESALRRLRGAPLFLPWALLALLAWIRSESDGSFDARASLELWWLAWAIGGLFSITVFSKTFRESWLWLHALIGLAVGIYAALQVFELDALCFRIVGLQPVVWDSFEWAGDFTRAVGTLGNPDFLAGYLIGTLPLLFPLWTRAYHGGRGTIQRGMVFLSGGAQLSAILLTLSRGVWVGILVAIIATVGFVVWARWRQRPRVEKQSSLLRSNDAPANKKPRSNLEKLATWMGATGVSLILITLVVWPSFNALSQRILQDRDVSVSGRAMMYEGTLRLIRLHPWTGTGMGTFGKHFPEVRPQELTSVEHFGERYIGHAHSEFLEVASDLGAGGLFLWFWLLLAAGATGVRAMRTASPGRRATLAACLIGIVAVVAHNMITVTLRHPPTQLLLWQLIGTLVGLERMGVARRDAPLPAPIRETRWAGAIILAAVAVIALWMPGVRHVAAEALLARADERLSRNDAPIENRRAALRDLARANALEPNRVGLWYLRAAVACDLGDYATSVSAYEKVLEIGGNFTSTLYNLGTVHLKESGAYLSKMNTLDMPLLSSFGRRAAQKAQYWFNLAVITDSTNPAYLDSLGRSYLITARYDEDGRPSINPQRLAQARKWLERARDRYAELALHQKKNRVESFLEDISKTESRIARQSDSNQE